MKNRRESPPQYAVFERTPQYCSAENPILLAPYNTEAEAAEAAEARVRLYEELT
jgi:hypothetical protein